MGKIVAIGGGSIFKNDTIKIDKYIVSLANKKIPKVLFIPTASSDNLQYMIFIDKYFRGLGCEVDTLCLVTGYLSSQEIKDKILNADIIYVGGGNTRKMLKIWKENSVDKHLEVAYKKGIILSGLSAGCICWFKWGCSDSDIYENGPENDFCKLKGLGFLNLANCPHYNEKGRLGFDNMILNEGITGVALEDCTALVEIDGKYSVIKSNDDYNAYKIECYSETIKKSEINSDVVLL